MRFSYITRRRSAAVVFLLATAGPLGAQAPADTSRPATTRIERPDGDLSIGTGPVQLTPPADTTVAGRIRGILAATTWFDSVDVRVDRGVVFLTGSVRSSDQRRWAESLARNTEGVNAVVNRVEIPTPSVFDFGIAAGGLRQLASDVMHALPLVVFGLLIMVVFGIAAWATGRALSSALEKRLSARLLRVVLARASAILVFLIGVYVILRVFGLTQLALTVIGGTGLIGLILGIAFRGISENFLASIFLSIQHPFRTGDLIEVDGITGFVQQLNMRTTVLLTLDGNQVQIPNGTVYQSSIRNFTTSPSRREEFVVGIGYDDAIPEAQEIARGVLAAHPAVLADPEPWVLVDSLGSATVNLRLYFWLDGTKHSWLKVRSSVIRLVKRAFQAHGISMPDDAREMLFPQGVPVTIVDDRGGAPPSTVGRGARTATAEAESDAVVTPAEGDLASDAGTIEAQARGNAPPAENLLGA